MFIVRFFETPWTAAYQAPLSMGFSRPEYWSGVPLPSLLLYSKSILLFLSSVQSLSRARLCDPMNRSTLGLHRRRQWHPTPALLPGKSHGQRSLVGCCLVWREPWICIGSKHLKLTVGGIQRIRLDKKKPRNKERKKWLSPW